MSDQQEWTIEFYKRDDGSSPPREFLDNLDDKTKVRFALAIEQLRVRNTQAREPLVKHLEDKLWELRRDSDKNTYRLLYFFFTGRKIVFVHGFQKKTQKAPRQEVELALKRMKDYIERKQEED
ncbi:MAG: toxin RelE [Chloroflexota bacterium]|nr:MAG: toxin RelE [Chloroflexota bacterium]